MLGTMLAPTLLAADGAWTWFNDTRALFHRGLLYYGYVKHSGSLPAVAVYDPQTGKGHELFELDLGLPDRDDHDNPALVVLPDGRLYVSAASHGHTQNFANRRSLPGAAAPLTPQQWEPQRFDPVPEPISYQNLFTLSAEGGRLYNFTRSIGWNPTLLRSDDNGTSWQPPLHLIKAAGRRRPYVKFASNGVDRIDVIYTTGHPQSVPCSIYHFFIKGGRLWHSDGSLLSETLSLDTDRGENGTPIYRHDAPASEQPPLPAFGGSGWIWDIAYGPEGEPVVLFQVQTDVPDDFRACRIDYFHARWSRDHGWERRWIARGGRPLYDTERHYGGGMALDPHDPRIISISSNAAAPFGPGTTAEHPLRPDERYRLYRGLMEGDSPEWTLLGADPANDYLRPYVPRGENGRALLCFRGEYRKYTDFSTGIVGWFF